MRIPDDGSRVASICCATHSKASGASESVSARALRASVRGERDPGYGSTSRLVAHSALALRHDVDRMMTPGGVWAPGAAFGLRLVDRLQAHAGLRFEVDNG